MKPEQHLHQQISDLQLAMAAVIDLFSDRIEASCDGSEAARLSTFRNVLRSLGADLEFYHPLICSGLERDYDDFTDLLVYNQRRLETMAGILHRFDAELANLLMDLSEAYAYCVPLVLIALVDGQRVPATPLAVGG